MGSRLDRIRDWEEIARKVSYCAAALAAQLQMSDRHLRRYFLLRFGEPPQHFLDNLRLTEAVKALARGLSIKEVAHQFGFKQPSHFSRKFKQTFGHSPSCCHVEPFEPLPPQHLAAKCPSGIRNGREGYVLGVSIKGHQRND